MGILSQSQELGEHLMSRAIILRRGVIGVHTQDAINVTRGSGPRALTGLLPTIGMLRAVKLKQIRPAEYLTEYRKRLESCNPTFWTELVQRCAYRAGLERKGTVYITCYCPEGADHCHAEVLIDYMIESCPCGVRFCREAKETGSSIPNLSYLNT